MRPPGFPDLAAGRAAPLQQPAYETDSPRYGLVVFGPQADVRVWLVRDGDWLYIDHNGNGDLTEPGKRVALPPYSGQHFPVQFRSSPAVEVVVNGRSWGKLELTESRLHAEFQPATPDEQQTWERFQHLDGGTAYRLEVTELAPSPRGSGSFFAARVYQMAGIDTRGRLVLATRREHAPVVHFDGPLTLEVTTAELPLQSGDDPVDFSVAVGTPGLGQGAFVCLAYKHYAPDGEITDVVPADVYPVAEVEFPARAPGGQPVQVEWVLKQRC